MVCAQGCIASAGGKWTECFLGGDTTHIDLSDLAPPLLVSAKERTWANVTMEWHDRKIKREVDGFEFSPWRRPGDAPDKRKARFRRV